MKPRSKRMMLVGGGVALLVAAVALVLSAFQQNLVFFHTPTDVMEGKAPTGKTFRIGGLVEDGSLQREADGLTVRFAITDTAKVIPVTYKGTLPDLFKEGKGAVIQGSLGADGQFRATEVLAKHDENYMPPEAAHAVEEAQKTAATVSQ
ncbi:MAG: cytochrome c maturation protein CcmE [Betaproteobacteria bacterium HGW-Betaproteobacteria-13]|uniref:Cytochrome c-type biogenesis protein CcmE n=1 Tax=Parazoarcus communis TaxID=41977 RepID=A0A2U8GS69_9RHOO|nr:cytochrome c maturation protein CcmE [Parazoarcus communis]AWI76502.1 cytochrome c biogenesis protein CcmE [Parazoarcus communis]AWI79206.1 cytochrome c biogenesis protein CcmE [Parazoarcus communis]PKO81645.1 MAG: cytochrome c maturation protein CcmE [Betaproteobacteria bacterium HGW-Betaproteobacteria-13]TVT59428.1 MAG: cytochrome c maturation protein CcmE [Azoarcus sp. PHD]